ncbi:hypothetical protein, partial [Nonomuraea insulae]
MELFDTHRRVHVRGGQHKVDFYLRLRTMGVFSDDAPATIRAFGQALGQLSIEELVDRYPIRCRPIRDLLVEYLRERQPSIKVMLVEPGQEGLGVGELFAGKSGDAGGEGLAGGASAQGGQEMPGGEPVQERLVRVAVEFGEAVGEPGFGVQELLVDGREHAAGHQQVAQIGDGPPAGELVKRLVSQGDATAGQAGEEVLDVGGAQPHPSLPGVGHA